MEGQKTALRKALNLKWMNKWKKQIHMQTPKKKIEHWKILKISLLLTFYLWKGCKEQSTYIFKRKIKRTRHVNWALLNLLFSYFFLAIMSIKVYRHEFVCLRNMSKKIPTTSSHKWISKLLSSEGTRKNLHPV